MLSANYRGTGRSAESELFYGWGGDREPWICGRGVPEVARTIWLKKDGWREKMTGQGRSGGRGAVECEGFEDWGVKTPETRDQNPGIGDNIKEGRNAFAHADD